MDKIVVNVHSVVDIITNSSTVIYTQATSGAIQTIKDIINAVLRDAGSDKTANDLYDIAISAPEWEMNFSWNSVYENRDLLLDWDYPEVHALVDGFYDYGGWSEIEMVNALLREQLTNEQLAELLGYACETYIVIKNKQGVESPISKQLTQLFNSEEVSSEG